MIYDAASHEPWTPLVTRQVELHPGDNELEVELPPAQKTMSAVGDDGALGAGLPTTPEKPTEGLPNVGVKPPMKGGHVSGTIRVAGQVPVSLPTARWAAGGFHSELQRREWSITDQRRPTKVWDDSLLVSKKQGLANAVVYLQKAPQGFVHEPPSSEPFVMTNETSRFSPRVAVMRAHDALCARQNNPQRQRGSEHESQIKLKVCGAHSLAHAAGYLTPAGKAVDRRGAHSLADAAGYIPQSQRASCAPVMRTRQAIVLKNDDSQSVNLRSNPLRTRVRRPACRRAP